jgi:type I restriction enzyme M protein
MITGELKSRVDKLWTEFWTGGITNPLTVIEQITFLMFARLLDITETRNERRAQRTGHDFRRMFSEEQQQLRWQDFRHLPAQEMLERVRDGVFPHFKTVSVDGARFGEFMKDAQFMIQKPGLLVSAVEMIEALPLDQSDTKGDLYEYLLSKLTTAGIQGQFRTPRHIIRLMVDMLEPNPDMVVGDPACGTAGFLVGVVDYLLRKNTSPAGLLKEGDTTFYTGDLLSDQAWQHIRNGMLHGFDFDTTMLRIGAMNLLLHGVESPDIHYQDTMSGSFDERFAESAQDAFDLILANPPFKGSLDEEDVNSALLRKVKTKKTELLFLVLILRMLKTGGRSATVVPDGVLFSSSGAHTAVRRMLVDDNQLEAVISLPPGVFKPYASVSAAVLVFAKGGRTDNVFFFDVQADGFSLDDKRQPTKENDLPECLDRWRNRNPEQDTDRAAKAFFVPADEIRESQYDLSVARYREASYKEEVYDPPKDILKRLKALNADTASDICALEDLMR